MTNAEERTELTFAPAMFAERSDVLQSTLPDVPENGKSDIAIPELPASVEITSVFNATIAVFVIPPIAKVAPEPPPPDTVTVSSPTRYP